MTLIATGISVLSYALMQTMVVPALYVLQVRMHTTPTWSAWILSVFLLTSAASTPLLSRLGDRGSRRKVLLLVLAVYLIGTLGCAAAGNIWLLIVCRGVQGVSLATLPLSFAILHDALPEYRRRSGLGLVSGVIGVGAGIGLVVGGLVVDHQSWRWLFAINALLILGAMGLVAKCVPDLRGGSGEPLDAPGATVLTLALVALLLALTKGTSWGWASGTTLALFAAFVVLLGLLVVVERRSPAPLVGPAVVAGRSMIAVHGAAFVFGLVSFVFYVLLPAYAQAAPDRRTPGGGTAGYGLGADVTLAGLLLLPGSLALLPAGRLAGLMQRLTSARATLTSGFAITAVGALSLWSWNHSAWQLAIGYLVVGSGSGLVLGALPSIVGNLTDARHTATANGVNTVIRAAGGVVGSQLAAVSLVAWRIPGSGIPARSGFTHAFLIAAAAAAAGGMWCWAGIGTSAIRRPSAPRTAARRHDTEKAREA